jgi:tetratricopeptide (TPR) repeat protein
LVSLDLLLVGCLTQAEKHYNLGTVLQDKGDSDGAIVEYRAAISLDPNYVSAHNNLGALLQNNGDLEGAIVEYRTALSLDPNHPYARINIGTVLAENGDSEGAIAEFRTAANDSIYKNKNAWKLAVYNLSGAEKEKNDPDGEIAVYHNAIRLNLNGVSPNRHYRIGNMLTKKGDLEGAIAAFLAALQLNPHHISAHYNLGRTFQVKGDFVLARKEFKEVLRLLPRTSENEERIKTIESKLRDLDKLKP